MANNVIDFLTSQGAVTVPQQTQEAAASQVNNATTGATGNDVATTNNAWGKAIPELIGKTRTVCLPLWTGNPKATFASNGDEVDTIDFAVIVGKRGPRSPNASLLRVWFDNVKVYDIDDPGTTTLAGEQLDFVFYDGTQKKPDPTIVAGNGKATPAFTGRVYIVFKGLLTQRITAQSTIKQFSKLPEVQLEMRQAETNLATGGVFVSFSDLPTVVSQSVDAIWVKKLDRLFQLDNNFIDVYDTAVMRFQGRTILAAPWNGVDANGFRFDRNAAHCLLSGDVLVCAQNDLGHNLPPYAVWDVITGALLYHDVPRDDAGGVFNPFNLVDCGNNWMLATWYGLALFRWTGTTLVNYGKLSDAYSVGGKQDYQDNFAALKNSSFSQIIYYASGKQLYRIVVTTGHKNDMANYGLVTNNKSNVQLRCGTYASLVLDLSSEAGSPDIHAVIVDPTDSRYVYIITDNDAASGMVLRRYGNFFYFNPQDGTAPPKGAFTRYSDPDFHLEVGRLAIPTCLFSDNGSENGAIYRDRRFPYFAAPTGYIGKDLLIMNLRYLTSNYYVGGELYNEKLQVINPEYFVYQRPTFYLPQSNEVLNFAAIGTPSPGKIKPYASAKEDTRYTLASLFIDNAILAGYNASDVLTIGLDDEVTGQQLNQTVNFKDLMAQYCAALRVDMTETETGGLSFVRRIEDRTPDGEILPGSLIPLSSDDTSKTVGVDRVAANEIPSTLQLAFINEDFGYQVGSQTARRTVYPHKTINQSSSLSLSLPLVMTDDDATYFAGIALFDMWASKATFSVNVPPSYIEREPGDIVKLTRPSGRVDLCKVTEVDIAPDCSLSLTLSSINKLSPVPYYQGSLEPSQLPPASGSAGVSYGTLTTPSPTGLYVTVIDNVDLGGAGNNVLIASSSPVDFYTQTDSDIPTKVATTDTAQQFGSIVAALPDSKNPFSVDIDTFVRVKLAPNAVPPATCSEADFHLGKNNVCIGAPGRWELVYFRNVAIDTDGNLILSRLLRGRRCTDNVIGTSVAGDLAVFDAIKAKPAAVPAGGQPVTVYGMPAGIAAAARGGVSDTLTASDGSAAPLAPRRLRASRAGNGDVTLTWRRRDRAASPDFWSDPPLSDAPEAYSLTITTGKGGRTVVVSQQSFTYTAAMQSDDGFATSPVQLSVSLYQIGARVKQGFVCKGTVNVG